MPYASDFGFSIEGQLPSTTPRMHLLIEMGCCSLDVTVEGSIDDVDLDGTFEAVCNDTGERLSINGWLADDITIVNA